MEDTDVYKEVRGLSRGLGVLRALNEFPGGIGSVAELSRSTGLHRTTVKRLLETLRAIGFVAHKDRGTSYALTYLVRGLSEGYVADEWIDRVAGPAMKRHLKLLSWPSDLATPDQGFMVVRESTHRESLLSQHHATIGLRFPALISSLGRAWLAWCSEDEREATLSLLSERTDEAGELTRKPGYARRIIRETQKRGYAINRGEWSGELSVTGIAMPVKDGEHAIGAINLVMRTSAVSEQKIANHYVPLLKALAEEISLGVTLLPRG